MRKERDTSADFRVVELARRQHAVASTEELLGLGISPAGITRRLQSGRLHRLHRGVYAIGHSELSQKGAWLAAVKACGRGASLSHQSAACLWSLLPDYRGPTHVTVPGTAGKHQRMGIVLHRSPTLTRRDWMFRDAIAVTNPRRTLRDLHRVLPRDQWEDATDRARSLHLPIGNVGESEPTRSRLERRMLALCRRHRLPKPEVNVRAGPYTADFLWRPQHLVVEADSFEHHGERTAFEADRARDAHLATLGYRVIRVTWRQLSDDPAGIAATLRAVLR